MLKRTLSGFQRCHRQHGSIFIQLALVASEMCEIPWNSPKIQFKIQGHPRSSIVVSIKSSYATSY